MRRRSTSATVSRACLAARALTSSTTSGARARRASWERSARRWCGSASCKTRAVNTPCVWRTHKVSRLDFAVVVAAAVVVVVVVVVC